MGAYKSFEKTKLHRCTVTDMLLPLELFTPADQRKIEEGAGTQVSALGKLWVNVSGRAVNGRYRASGTKHGRGMSYVRNGIRMADEWVNDPTRFAWDVLAEIGMPRTREGKRLSLDRIDNDGDYVPGNLRWATALEQVLNSDATKVEVY